MEPSPQRRAIEEVQRLVEAAEDLATMLEVATSRYRTALSHLESGDDAHSVMALIGVADLRADVTASLDAFIKQRHASRVAIIGLESEEGMSINAIAKSWGISRQLASSVANRARVPGPQ